MKSEKYLLSGKYATYKNEEFRVTVLKKDGATLITNDPKYQDEKFGFSKYISPYGSLDEDFYIKKVIPEKLTNAYNLDYEAIYKGQKFRAGVSQAPKIVLFSDISQGDYLPHSLGFENINKGEWVKEVDISEVEIITIKEPIDLNSLLIK